MYALPILPDELSVPLDGAGLAGCVAFARPLDVEAQAKWQDAFPGKDQRNAAAAALVRDQLLRIEGLTMVEGELETPYDPKDAQHFASLPTGAVSEIYAALIGRAIVPEALEKNSGSPSGSDGTKGGKSTRAGRAARKRRTS